MNKTVATLFIATFLVWSCGEKENQKKQNKTGNLVFSFEHFVDGKEIIFDKMGYVNAAGNEYEIREIQYFVSDVTLNRPDGTKFNMQEQNFAHYIDTNIPSTNTWMIEEDVPEGNYESISMIFGIRGEKNKPLMFTDPPESDMIWPMHLGGEEGGYHYMKLNGFWINKENEREPFNFHLGVGQQKDEQGQTIGFIQNWIEIVLPNSSFTLNTGEIKEITIRMNVEKWWEYPNVYDHNIHGSKIMQNQQAMRMGVENGYNVFELITIKAKEAI